MRLPGLANLITLSRFAFIFLAGYCIYSYTPGMDIYRWGAIAFVILAILSDIADGKAARLLKQESYIGGVMDAAADALGFTLGFIFLWYFDLGMRFPLWFVAIVVGREAAVYGMFLAVLLKNGRIEKKPSRLAKWNTTLLAVCVLLLLLRFEYAWPLWALASATTLITGYENVASSLKAIRANNKEERSITV